jgi:hypothetical protein
VIFTYWPTLTLGALSKGSEGIVDDGIMTEMLLSMAVIANPGIVRGASLTCCAFDDAAWRGVECLALTLVWNGQSTLLFPFCWHSPRPVATDPSALEGESNAIKCRRTKKKRTKSRTPSFAVTAAATEERESLVRINPPEFCRREKSLEKGVHMRW